MPGLLLSFLGRTTRYASNGYLSRLPRTYSMFVAPRVVRRERLIFTACTSPKQSSTHSTKFRPPVGGTTVWFASSSVRLSTGFLVYALKGQRAKFVDSGKGLHSDVPGEAKIRPALEQLCNQCVKISAVPSPFVLQTHSLWLILDVV
jgi:hypothetical protein